MFMLSPLISKLVDIDILLRNNGIGLIITRSKPAMGGHKRFPPRSHRVPMDRQRSYVTVPTYLNVSLHSDGMVDWLVAYYCTALVAESFFDSRGGFHGPVKQYLNIKETKDCFQVEQEWIFG